MRASFLVVITALTVAAAACEKQDAAPPAPGAAAAPSAAPSEPPPIPPRTGTALDDVLDNYEQLRAKLAGDDFAGAKPFAEKVMASAGAALPATAGSPAEAHVKAIQESAQKVATAADMPTARMAFGDMSKATVSLLVAKPELQTGRFLMMCPMAKGYQKWVQTDQKLRNPYYGSEMLECGEQLKAWSV